MKFSAHNLLMSLKKAHDGISSDNLEEKLKAIKDVCHAHVSDAITANDIYLQIVGNIAQGRATCFFKKAGEKEKCEVLDKAQELNAEYVSFIIGSYVFAEEAGGSELIRKIITENSSKSIDEITEILKTAAVKNNISE